MPRPLLRTVLFLSLTAAIALPLAYLGMTQVRQWQQVRRHEVGQELQFAAEALAHSVAQSVDGDIRGIEAMAGEIGTNQVLDVNQLQAVIHACLERFPGCESMHVSGLDARAIAAEPDRGIVGTVYRDRAFYRRMMSSGGTAVDFFLWESNAILQCLTSKKPGAGLWPSPPRERANVLYPSLTG